VASNYTYRNLIIWNRAQELALSVIGITQRLQNTWANAILARQAIASATSVAANIAEGHGRYTLGAHRNHLAIAKGSLAETDSWLDLMRRTGIVSEEEEQRLHDECDELAKMLLGKIRDLEKMEQTKSGRLAEQAEQYADDSLDQPCFPFSKPDYNSSYE
jgi:four helix bundle protein